MKDIISLGIESSCDETSIAIVKNGRDILSNIVSTQISTHEKFGGVVPEIASRMHVEIIDKIYKMALDEAKISQDEIDIICPTVGPGLIGALLVGLSFAKGLSLSLNKPLIGVNHLEGHICANFLTYKELKPPFVCLLISGGNTVILDVKDYTKYEILGKTRDDAIGEAFDKVARVLGLGYPGGPKIDELAKSGKNLITLPKTNISNMDFSFSGIKTAIINLNHNVKEINKADLALSFEHYVSQVLKEHIYLAMKETNYKKLVLGGGVSANSYIRNQIKEQAKQNGYEVYFPELKLCTDNAAMIASSGYFNYINGQKSKIDVNAICNLKLGDKL